MRALRDHAKSQENLYIVNQPTCKALEGIDGKQKISARSFLSRIDTWRIASTRWS